MCYVKLIISSKLLPCICKWCERMNTGRWAWEGIEVVLASFLPTLCNVEHYCCALSVAMLKANPIRIDSMVQSAFQQGCCPKIEHRLAMLLLTTFNICTFHSGCGILSFTKWHDIRPVFCRPLPLSHPLYHDSPIASFFFQIHIVHVLCTFFVLSMKWCWHWTSNFDVIVMCAKPKPAFLL